MAEHENEHDHQKDDEMSLASLICHEKEGVDEDDNDDEKAMREMMLTADAPHVHASIRCKNEVLAKQVKDKVALMRYMRSKQGASDTKAYHKDMAAKAKNMHKAQVMQAKQNYEKGVAICNAFLQHSRTNKGSFDDEELRVLLSDIEQQHPIECCKHEACKKQVTGIIDLRGPRCHPLQHAGCPGNPALLCEVSKERFINLMFSIGI